MLKLTRPDLISILQKLVWNKRVKAVNKDTVRCRSGIISRYIRAVSKD